MVKNPTVWVKIMNETSRVFLSVIKAAVHAEQPQLQKNITPQQWHELFHMATIHNVLPLFYEAISRQLPLSADPRLLSAMKQKMRQQIILQTIRTAEFLELNDRMLAAGIKPLVVKGIVCRSLYAKPDHRPSSDEDVRDALLAASPLMLAP